MIVHGNPELRTTGERWNASHKSRESVVGQKRASSVGQGLWQRTRRAVSGGMSAVFSSRTQLAV